MVSLSASNASSFSESVPLCRKFWRAGDYEAGAVLRPVSQNGQNRLRVHPKFLHSNATSHKWAFGAVAELLDNAIDEVQNGATFVILDKITNPQNGDHALLIQDDGGGMNPESLRCCMSFGFSDKQSYSSIGQYGNGFKTSTMRLGADVIVFSRCMNKRTLTQSVGLLSYTFLKHTGSDDIIVPMVDYEFDSSADEFRRLLCYGDRQFSSNLSALLKWSPFATEAELLKQQFNDIGLHGTKIIVFNLWFDDEGSIELDFESDAEDIMISGAPKIVQTNNISKMLTQKHIAKRIRHSLRAYSSILYLHLPESFKIILRGQVVEPHHIASDLRYRECIKYKPQDGGGVEVITTIGFLEGAPNLNVHGFNVYHKNRLILPFWPVSSYTNGKGRGVAGVLEANFIRPTHDKQDFERSNLYQKLETRLREMTVEYWDYHCHLVGYSTNKSFHSIPRPTSDPAQIFHLGKPNGIPQAMIHSGAPNTSHQLASSTTCGGRSVTLNPGPSNFETPGTAPVAGISQDLQGNPFHYSADQLVVTAPSASTYLTPRQFTNCNASSQSGLLEKRKCDDHIAPMAMSKKQAVVGGVAVGPERNHKRQHDYGGRPRQNQEMMTIIQENKKLTTECMEYEKAEKQLVLKAQKLQRELQEVQQIYNKLTAELKLMNEVNVKL